MADVVELVEKISQLHLKPSAARSPDKTAKRTSLLEAVSFFVMMRKDDLLFSTSYEALWVVASLALLHGKNYWLSAATASSRKLLLLSNSRR